MSNKSLDRRKPVWIALSDFWLDNQIDERWAEKIAGVINFSGYSEAEINDIFTYELAPFLYQNHLSVAGEWSGFDPDWVVGEAMKHLGHKTAFSNIANKIGISTFAARAAFESVNKIAFAKDS